MVLVIQRKFHFLKKSNVYQPFHADKPLQFVNDFREECSNKGGLNAGSCASGFGVCCTCKLMNNRECKTETEFRNSVILFNTEIRF